MQARRARVLRFLEPRCGRRFRRRARPPADARRGRRDPGLRAGRRMTLDSSALRRDPLRGAGLPRPRRSHPRGRPGAGGGARPWSRPAWCWLVAVAAPAAPARSNACCEEFDVHVVAVRRREWPLAGRSFPSLWPRTASGSPELRRLPGYAAAAAADDSLLFVGDDFARTDITRVIPSASGGNAPLPARRPRSDAGVVVVVGGTPATR